MINSARHDEHVKHRGGGAGHEIEASTKGQQGCWYGNETITISIGQGGGGRGQGQRAIRMMN